MSIYKSALNSSFVIKDFFKLQKYRTSFSLEHPEYFPADGLVVFCGGQGAGKTLSAVRYLDRLCKDFPSVIVVSNIGLHLSHEPAQIIPYTSLDDVREMDNGYAGIVLLLDEIQILFNSLESKGIHPSVFQTISQQRKRRLHVIGTTQLFGRLAKPWREQCNVCVDCSALLGGSLQRNSVIDFGSIAEDINGNLTSYEYSYHSYWFRSPQLFNMYDTFEKVERRSNVSR